MNPAVTFLKVRSNQDKLSILCQTVQNHYEKKEKILITVPNSGAAEFMDDLLWRFPEQSFLPHCISLIPTEERIVITTNKEQNLNQAAVLINLNSEITPHFDQFQQIYELYDTTHPDKEKLSKQKQQIYQAKNAPVRLVASFVSACVPVCVPD